MSRPHTQTRFSKAHVVTWENDSYRKDLKMKRIVTCTLALVLALLLAPAAPAAITWVEVDSNNTTGNIETDDFNPPGDNTDNLWDEWDGDPQIGPIALLARNSEDAGPLETTLNVELDTGVDYNFFVLFRSDVFNSVPEGIQVKLGSEGTFQSFTQNSAGAQQFASSNFYYANFATVTGGAGTDSVIVDVDQFVTANSGQFTIYDAIGFEQAVVIPTPAALPAGLAMLGLIAMRRRSTKLTTSRR